MKEKYAIVLAAAIALGAVVAQAEETCTASDGAASTMTQTKKQNRQKKQQKSQAGDEGSCSQEEAAPAE